MPEGGNDGRHRKASTQICGSATDATYPANARAYQTILEAYYEAWKREDARIAAKDSVKDTGIEVGEVIAWRCWKAKGNRLHSIAMEWIEWPPDKPLEAGEELRCGKVGPWVGQGIHAFKSKKDAYLYGCEHQLGSILGQVKLWGRIYELERGYHAEMASVHSLAMLPVTCFPLYPFPFYELIHVARIWRLRRIYGV